LCLFLSVAASFPANGMPHCKRVATGSTPELSNPFVDKPALPTHHSLMVTNICIAARLKKVPLPGT
jgi:hypothetical protein